MGQLFVYGVPGSNHPPQKMADSLRAAMLVSQGNQSVIIRRRLVTSGYI